MRLRHAVAAVLLLLCAAVPAVAVSTPPIQDLFAIQKALKTGLIPSSTAMGAGTASGTGVVATETRAGELHSTLLTLTAVSVATADHTTDGGSGSLLIYTFPEGIINVSGCVANLTTSEASAGITATAALVHSLGSVAEGGDAALTSTEADIIASTSGTLSSSAGTFAGFSAAAVRFDGHATAAKVYLQTAMPDAASSGAGAIVYSGTIKCTWNLQGDF